MSTFLTGENIARIAAKIAAEDLGLAALVFRDTEHDFSAGGGTSVSIPVPGVTTTNTRAVGSTTDYVLGQVAESKITVELETEAYSVVPVSLKESSLDIKDFSRQVLRPQALTVANHAEAAVAAEFAAVVPDAAISYNVADPKSAVIRARAKLRANGVSADRPITVVAGANVFADMLLAEQIVDGKIAGLPVVENTMVAADALFVFVREAIALAVRAPSAPEGATYAASVTEGGFSLTAMRALNGANGVTNSILTSYLGVKPLPLAVANYATGAVDLVAGGGIVAIDTVP